jgi:hypothetical protein
MLHEARPQSEKKSPYTNENPVVLLFKILKGNKIPVKTSCDWWIWAMAV